MFLRLPPSRALRAGALALLLAMECMATVASAREPGAPRRFGGARAAAMEARAARQADRAQQRAIQRGQMRPEPAPAPMAIPAPVEPQPAAPVGRPGRLTPDERRALRQQINDAGRDIYRPERP